LRNTVLSLGVSVLVILGCGGGGGGDVDLDDPIEREPEVRSRFDTAVAEPYGRAAPEPAPAIPTLSYGLLGADITCAPCGAGPEDVGAEFHAGSTLQGNYALYGPKRAFDGDATTAWCEGEEDEGEGIGIEVTFQHPVHLAGMYVLGGYFKDRPTLEDNGRLAVGQVLISGPKNVDVAFDDPITTGQDNITGELITDPDKWFDRVRSAPAMWTPPAEWHDDEGQVVTDFVSLNIKEVHSGEKYQDTCISEIRLVIAPAMDPM
jgi:hypothetical protein